MAERFERRFALENDLYTPGAPLLLRAGALLYDRYSGQMLAQLKFKNIAPESIRMLKVRVRMLDSLSEPLGQPVDYCYQDLDIPRDGEFGRNTAIVLPNRNVRAFTTEVLELVFAGGGRWTPGDAPWQPLAPPRPLAQELGGEELALQYRTQYGPDCAWALQEQEDLWTCVCGGINRREEDKCHSCRRSLEALREVNLSSLRADCDKRLEQEQELAEEDKAEAGLRRKKWLKAACILVPLLILAIGLLVTVPKTVSRHRSYAAALALVENGRYAEAEAAFRALGDYSDSVHQLKENIPYQRAMHMLNLAETGDESQLSFIRKTSADMDKKYYGDYAAQALFYQAAGDAFTALGEYQDCRQRAAQCVSSLTICRQNKLQDDYQQASALLGEGSYCRAAAAFTALGDFEDSAGMAMEALYQKATALYGFTEAYTVRYIYAKIQTDPETASVFLISRSEALELGQDCISDLRAACGSDSAEISLSDNDGGLIPMRQALAELFDSLGDYKDSKQYAQALRQAEDYTRDFFRLVEEGELTAAADWLNAYEEEFEGREDWLKLLELYKPFCGNWSMSSGDWTLIPRSGGISQVCTYLSSKVIIGEDKAVLRLTYVGEDSAEHSVELTAERGGDSFSLSSQGALYLAVLSKSGNLAYLQYNGDNVAGSVEYTRSTPEE